MGKFKEGQYVVATRDALHIKKGDIVQVERYARPTAIGDWLMIKDKRNATDDGSYEEQYFTAWIPNVGERVAEAEPRQYDFVSHWRDFWEGAEGPLTNGAFVVTKVTGGFVHYSNRVDGNGPQATLDCFEPLPVAAEAQPAATLKIEAGKFYRTRDGRKVGPMYVYSDGWSEKGDAYCRMWRADGRRYYNNDPESDLIAEWQDTPSAPVAAQVDTIAEEYGPAPPQEPDTTLHIKFTSDFSELDAAILVRKKKLKKLIKLAAKAGIELREAA